jgi:6-phosphogluconate dehydrogenase (decarboxylating)
MSDKQIGLIGLGLVGTALVERFLPAGFEVFGYDIDQSKLDAQQGDGFVACKSPAEVAEKTRRIVLSLPNSTIVNEAVEGQKGVLETAEPGAIIIDTTTADPDMSVTLARHVQKRSIRFLDATMCWLWSVVHCPYMISVATFFKHLRCALFTWVHREKAQKPSSLSTLFWVSTA